MAMAWTKHSDSFSWSPGHSGKGFILHDGTIKTWNVDPFNPVDHHQVLLNNNDGPMALAFEIDPDGGVVTAQPTDKLKPVIEAEPRLYDAGQRPTFETDWNLDHFEPKEEKEGKPDFNFVMSAEAPLPINMNQGCPRCHSRGIDDETGECPSCGYVIPYDGWEQMQGHPADGPVPGYKAVGWGTALDDDDVNRADLGPPHYGAMWEWPAEWGGAADPNHPYTCPRCRQQTVWLDSLAHWRCGNCGYHVGDDGGEVWDMADFEIGRPDRTRGVIDPENTEDVGAWLPFAGGPHYGAYGYTNDDTSTVALIMDNESGLSDASRKLVEKGGTPEQLRDWAMRKIVGPHNREQIKDAKEWNAIPLEERQRMKRERDIAEFGEAAVNLGEGLMQPFNDWNNEGKSEEEIRRDEEYEAPDLIDPELVNWNELHQGILDDLDENAAYDRRQRENAESAGALGIGWNRNGGDDEDKLRDAFYRYHGAIPEEELKQEYGDQYSGNDPRNYFRRNVNIPLEQFKQMPNWPAHYLAGGPDTPRNQLFDHRYKIAEEKARQEMLARGYAPDLVEEILNESGGFGRDPIRKHFPGGKYDTEFNLEDPQERAILENHPTYQGWAQNGYDMRVGDLYQDVHHAIAGGQPHPYINQMAQALRQRGYPPEEIQRLMQQQWQWDESAQTRIPVNQQPPVEQWAEQVPPNLDEPGDLYFPKGWTSHTGALQDHQLWYTPGRHPWRDDRGQVQQDWGRGLLTPEGKLVTWPTVDATHNGMIQALGYEDRERGERTPVQFKINPTGQIRVSDPGFYNDRAHPWIAHQILQADPSGKLNYDMPLNDEALHDWDPETGQWRGLTTAGALSPATELREWLADLGGSEPEISIHHNSEDDLIQAPPVSPSNDLPYFPPGHVPDQYKQAGMTLPQEQRAWEQIDQGSPVIGQLPNGYTIQRHDDALGVNSVGEFLRNCWQERSNDRIADERGKGFEYHSLHDEHGLPRAAFYVATNPRIAQGHPSLTEMVGARNQELKPEHAQVLADWATQAGHKIKGKEPQEWLDSDSYWRNYWDQVAEQNRQRNRGVTAGMTRNQYLRQMAELEAKMGPDKSRPNYQFDNGWSVVAPKSQRDVKRVGTLMGHCWQSGTTGSGDPYVLRDPDGIPRIAWNTTAPHMAGRGYTPAGLPPGQQVFAGGAHSPSGHNSSEPRPEHWDMLREWAAAQQPPVKMWHYTGDFANTPYGGHEFGDPGPNPYFDPVANEFITKAAATPQTSWHLTDNPQFALDPAHVPQDNALAINERTQPGLYVGDPEHWFNGYDYVRPFAAEIEHPQVEAGRWGGENFIPAEAFPQSRVKRVIPIDEWVRETYGEPGWIEEFHDHNQLAEPRQPGDIMTRYRKFPNYRYEGPDVRDMSPVETARQQARVKAYIKSVRPHMIEEDLAHPHDLPKQAMAERSGFPELDQAIEQFMQTHPDLENYRDPQNAWGACDELADACAEFLKQRGFKAYATHDEVGAFPGYEDAQKSEAIGAGDFSYPEHAMVEVYGLYGPNNVNNVTIDFTASQYGFTEFPKVHGGPADRTGSVKVADSPITQADATNDALGKTPSIEPGPQDPDYLQPEACPHCFQQHRPDEPCADSSVGQWKAEQRSWYDHDPNAVHSAPEGLSDHAVDLGRTAAKPALWWQPGGAGRGMVMRDGSVRTWPEGEGTHHQHAYQLNMDPVHTFLIRPSGEYYSHEIRWPGTPETHAAIQQADPRLQRIDTPPDIQAWWGRSLASTADWNGFDTSREDRDRGVWPPEPRQSATRGIISSWMREAAPQMLGDLGRNPEGLPRPLDKLPNGQLGPVPWSQGTESWGNMDPARAQDAHAHRLCLLCGKEVGEGKVFAMQSSDPYEQYVPAQLGYVIDNGPLHDRCAAMTAAHCPELKRLLDSGEAVERPYIDDTSDAGWNKFDGQWDWADNISYGQEGDLPPRQSAVPGMINPP